MTTPRIIQFQVFQSSPALSSGRYPGCLPRRRLRYRFNPRPPFRAGATIHLRKGGGKGNVSILARPFERALLPQPTPHLPQLFRFNPRPPFRAGATWRRARTSTRRRGFNPRPPFRAGATNNAWHDNHSMSSFNPRPPFRAGATS